MILQDAAPKPLLTVDEFLAQMQGAIGRNSVYDLLRANRIKHLKVGRKILIPSSEVTGFIERETALPMAA